MPGAEGVGVGSRVVGSRAPPLSYPPSVLTFLAAGGVEGGRVRDAALTPVPGLGFGIR